MERTYEGNIRELENLMERCTILSDFDPILEDEGNVPVPVKEVTESSEPAFLEQSLEENMDLRTLEDAYIRRVYEQTGNNVGRTCEILGINRSTLWRKMKD